MTQLSEEQQEQLKQIRGRHWLRSKHGTPAYVEAVADITTLLSLLDSDSQAATEVIPDDLPYRIVEEMGLGLPFRSCTCGQLPCARLRPLRDALETVRRSAATLMRDKCVEMVKRLRSEWQEKHEQLNTDADLIERLSLEGDMRVADTIINTLECLTLDQVKPGEM